MKKIFVILGMIAFLFSTVCWADSVTLQWEASVGNNLNGYHIYRAEKIGNLTTAWEKIGTVAKDILTYTDEVDDKNYAWMVTAFDTEERESFPSNMAEKCKKVSYSPAINLLLLSK